MIILLIGDWWSSLGNSLQIFWGISIIFSVLFVIQFVLSLIGFDFDTESDTDVAGHDYSLDSDFSLLSIRSIIAFFTFFGWTGVLVMNSGGNAIMGALFGLLSGLTAMFIVAYLIYLFSKLSEEGNVNINDAIYNTGEVYLSIPASNSGQGKIHLKINGTIREVDSITKGEMIPTGSTVRVVEIINSNLIVVEPVNNLLAN